MFFSYLRQRTRESVLAGIRDALLAFDSGPMGGESTAASIESGASSSTPDDAPLPQSSVNLTDAAVLNGSPPLAIAVRKRGRPRKEL